jgi:hypothetical protein
MSERLVFELLAVDRATAPLKAVQTQLDNTTAATKKLGNQTSGTAKDFRKFTLGGLQQAGFQIGDFFVQVANGTNQMQAFGQQAPQFLQIFGPIGSVVGAAVAVFAAFSVIAEKSASAVSASVGRYAESLDKLSAAIQNAKDAIDQFRFGDSIADLTENEIKSLESQVQRLRQLLTELRTTETSGASTGLQQIAAMFSRDAAIEEFQTRKEELRVIEEKLQVFQALNEAQRMLNGGLSVAAGIQKGLVYDKEVELRTAKEAEIQRIARGEAIYGQMIAIQSAQAEYIKSQESFNQRLMEGYGLYGALRRQAQALSEDAAAAAAAAQAAAVGAGRGLGRQGPELDPYGFRAQLERDRAAADRDSDTASGGGAIDPMKTLREQLALETELIGKTEAQQRVIQALGLDYKKYGETALNSLVVQITEMDRLNKLAEQQKEIANTIRSAFEGAFMSMVDGTKSVAQAFKDMTRQIIMKLYEQLVVQQMVNAAMGLVGSIFPSLAPFLSGTRAMGGQVTSGKAYLVGERGPEIVVPSRNGQVVPNNQMGGNNVTVNQSISFGAGVTRAEIQAMLPKIVESTKAAVFDAQRRSVNGMGY